MNQVVIKIQACASTWPDNHRLFVLEAICAELAAEQSALNRAQWLIVARKVTQKSEKWLEAHRQELVNDCQAMKGNRE